MAHVIIEAVGLALGFTALLMGTFWLGVRSEIRRYAKPAVAALKIKPEAVDPGQPSQKEPAQSHASVPRRAIPTGTSYRRQLEQRAWEESGEARVGRIIRAHQDLL